MTRKLYTCMEGGINTRDFFKIRQNLELHEIFHPHGTSQTGLLRSSLHGIHANSTHFAGIKLSILCALLSILRNYTIRRRMQKLKLIYYHASHKQSSFVTHSHHFKVYATSHSIIIIICISAHIYFIIIPYWNGLPKEL